MAKFVVVIQEDNHEKSYDNSSALGPRRYCQAVTVTGVN